MDKRLRLFAQSVGIVGKMWILGNVGKRKHQNTAQLYIKRGRKGKRGKRVKNN
jgi:hypothetical protein